MSDVAGPEAMRELVRTYVDAVHTSYLSHVRDLPPAERATLPLIAASDFTVVAAAAQRLHLIATTDRLPAVSGQEVELIGQHHRVHWTLRFYDPSVLPGLGLLTEDSASEVRRIIGVTNTVYHLTVEIGGGLSSHNAHHSGVAMANQDAKLGRDLERVREALPERCGLVDELDACVRIGLDRAAALIIAELSDGRVTVEPGMPAAACLEALLDRARR